ncbi:MAG: hypothetical protein SPL39_11845 [Selenomonadaceae bacterium]|nr:hypothetical protein [Selenomonadaceae bacterium]
MKLSDIPIPGAPGLGSLEDIATALRNFLNGYHRPREEYFSDFINLLYEPTNLEDLYPLDFIMKRTINEENLDLACSIIRKNSWAVRQTWDNQFIFSKGFMKLADIPIFIPTIYPGIVSAVFLLFLLFPDKKTGIHFYSGLEKKSAKEIILHGPTV